MDEETKERLRSGRTWSTQDEVVFLKRIGEWAWSHRVRSHSRLELLRKYQQAAMSRANWDTLDRGAIMERVEKEIAKEDPNR